MNRWSKYCRLEKQRGTSGKTGMGLLADVLLAGCCFVESVQVIVDTYMAVWRRHGVSCQPAWCELETEVCKW